MVMTTRVAVWHLLNAGAFAGQAYVLILGRQAVAFHC